MRFSTDLEHKIAERFSQQLSAIFTCPCCNNKDFKIPNMVYNLIPIEDQLKSKISFNLDESINPFILVVCKKCAYTSIFSLISLGLLEETRLAYTKLCNTELKNNGS